MGSKRIKQRKPGQQHRAKYAHHQRLEAQAPTPTPTKTSMASFPKQANRPSKRGLDNTHTHTHMHRNTHYVTARAHCHMSLDKRPSQTSPCTWQLQTAVLPQTSACVAGAPLDAPCENFKCTAVHTLAGSTNTVLSQGPGVTPHVRCTLPPWYSNPQPPAATAAGTPRDAPHSSRRPTRATGALYAPTLPSPLLS